MAGYYGYKMSNNAVAAYSEGEKPFSKWLKSEILELIKEELPGTAQEQKLLLKELKKIKAKDFKSYLLKCTSWHHTSSRYNKTDFYSLNYSKINNLTIEDIRSYIETCNNTSNEPTERRALCTFLEWSGTRKHPKATECTEPGTIKGESFYKDSDGRRKSINANGFEIVKYL